MATPFHQIWIRARSSCNFAYEQVQQWLAQTLGVEAEYHAVYQMARYRLKAKLKATRPQNIKQDPQQRDAFEQTLPSTLSY